MSRNDAIKVTHRSTSTFVGVFTVLLMLALAGCENPLAGAAQAARADAVAPRIVLSTASGSLSAGANIDFGTVPVGSAFDITLTLDNSGKSDLVVDVASIKVTLGNFSVKTNPPATIPAGKLGTLVLSLTPTSGGLRSATVSIPTNDTKVPIFTFTVSGTGISIDLTTAVVDPITYTSASSGGTVVTDGGSTIIARGICWSTSLNPTIANYKSTDTGGGTGSFTCGLTGLNPGTFYYVRAWATNSDGTAYGLSNSFTTTAATSPTTTSISDINATTAASGCTTTADAGVTISSCGICWGTSSNPTIASSNNSGTSGASISLSGLALATTYYVRAYATNQGGTVYGNQLTLKTVGYIGPSGGYVFYDAGSIQSDSTYGNWRYMEAAPSDQGTSVWGDTTTSVPGTLTAVGGGKVNTAYEITFPTTGTAAKLCNSQTFNGNSGWFLPSRDELNLMLLNLKQYSLAGFQATSYYWCSSEYNTPSAYNQRDFYVSATGAPKDNSIRYVRAARRY